jgi:hypothetical protein
VVKTLLGQFEVGFVMVGHPSPRVRAVRLRERSSSHPNCLIATSVARHPEAPPVLARRQKRKRPERRLALDKWWRRGGCVGFDSGRPRHHDTQAFRDRQSAYADRRPARSPPDFAGQTHGSSHLRRSSQIEKATHGGLFNLVETRRIELPTFALRTRRSPS